MEQYYIIIKADEYSRFYIQDDATFIFLHSSLLPASSKIKEHTHNLQMKTSVDKRRGQMIILGI